jgi:N-acetylmuramoyl-L-alanine amidase
MKATSISSHESDFFNLKKDTDGKVFDITEVTKKIKGTEEEIVFYKCRINEKYKDDNPDKIKPFFKKPKNPPQKKQIVLHFTAGYLRGDIATLTRGSSKDKEGKLIIPWHVSVPFVIARNGKIFQLWNENKYWAKHLGLKGNANTTCNQKTIGIELSNIGPLLKKGKNLVTTYGKNQVYCGLEDKEKEKTKIKFSIF